MFLTYQGLSLYLQRFLAVDEPWLANGASLADSVIDLWEEMGRELESMLIVFNGESDQVEARFYTEEERRRWLPRSDEYDTARSKYLELTKGQK